MASTRRKLDRRFLGYFIRTPAFFEQVAAQGSKNYAAIRPAQVLEYTLPLPPLAEQRRLVERLDVLAAKIEEAKRLRADVSRETETFTHSHLNKFYEAQRAIHGVVQLRDVCSSITDGAHLTPAFEDKGVKFIFVGNVSSSYLHFVGCKHVSSDYYSTVSASRKPQRGDVLYSAVGATLGIPALVDTDDDFCFQRHVAIIKPDRNRLNSKYLWYMLRSGTLFQQAWASITGTAQPTVPLKAIKMFPIPVPPMTEQKRIIVCLDNLRTRLEELNRHQVEASNELNAMLPAILDRAFRGELL